MRLVCMCVRGRKFEYEITSETSERKRGWGDLDEIVVVIILYEITKISESHCGKRTQIEQSLPG